MTEAAPGAQPRAGVHNDVHRLFAAEPEPPFHDAAEQAATWQGPWGASDDVGPLRHVLLCRPGDEWSAVRADCWNPEAGALVDPAMGWYWEAREPPDIGLMRAQHDELVGALSAAGVEVSYVEERVRGLVNAVFARDPVCPVPGGMVVCRMAVRMRRGEERPISRALGLVGAPILRTISGTGTLEGGSVVRLAPGLAAVGTSWRVNDEGARQLAEVLATSGTELVKVPLPYPSIHLDGSLSLVRPDLALVDTRLPPAFLARLRAAGIEPLARDPGETWALNGLALAPGHLLLSEGSPATRRLLEARGVQVDSIRYDEVQKGGGGIHCSTVELRRDPAS